MLISKEKATERFRRLTGLSIAESRKAVASMPSVTDGKREKVDEASVVEVAIRLLAQAKSMEPRERGGLLSPRMAARLHATNIQV